MVLLSKRRKVAAIATAIMLCVVGKVALDSVRMPARIAVAV